MTTALADLRVGYIGNFRPTHSTENHVARAFRSHGAHVEELQEDNPDTWMNLERSRPFDVILWTHTWSFMPPPFATAVALAKQKVPIVGYHLDRMFGLQRAELVTGRLKRSHAGTDVRDPFFLVPDMVVTADGGHDEGWVQAGILHRWLPPGVLGAEVEVLEPRQESPRRIAFVGSWSGYHQEWPHRQQLVKWLSDRHGKDLVLYPVPGQPAVRGRALNVLYRTHDVIVGDSCLAGGATHYWSDRIPETLGRGGLLIHPNVVGLEEHFTPGEHLLTWNAGDWEVLDAWVDKALNMSAAEREQIALAGREHVLAHHTYEVRARQLVDLMVEEGLL